MLTEAAKALAKMLRISEQEMEEIHVLLPRLFEGKSVSEAPTILTDHIDKNEYSKHMITAIAFEIGIQTGRTMYER